MISSNTLELLDNMKQVIVSLADSPKVASSMPLSASKSVTSPKYQLSKPRQKQKSPSLQLQGCPSGRKMASIDTRAMSGMIPKPPYL